ncbi:MAG: hypothetical protein JSR86_11780 [Proteobacteria bacterium]|nr:hypothetical protein [Pseudomonadota bacterium]
MDLATLAEHRSALIQTIAAVVCMAVAVGGMIARSREGHMIAFAAIIIAVILFGLAYLGVGGVPPPSGVAVAATPASGLTIAPQPPGVSAAATNVVPDPPPRLNFYVKRDAPRYLAPRLDAATSGEIARNQPVSGVLVPAAKGRGHFLQIEDGLGGRWFLRDTALSSQPRPTIVPVEPDRLVMFADADVFDEPDGRTIRQHLSPGINITIVGRTDDQMYEIQLQDGGAGYLRLGDGDARPRATIEPPF